MPTIDENAALDAYLFHRDARREDDASPPNEGGETALLRALDGAPLEATVFRAAKPLRGRPPVVIASATGVRRAYYGSFAGHLSRRGLDVVTFDYRGIGGSREAAERPKMHDWGEQDLAGVVAFAGARLGPRDGGVSIVGHSVGGQLVGLLPEPHRVRRVLTVGAQSGDYRLWPLPYRLAMAALWYGVVPGVTRAVGYLPGALGIGEDLPPGVALEWAAWCRTPGYLVGGGAESRRAGFEAITAPLLAYSFDDDELAPPAAVTSLLSLYRRADVERREVHRSDVGPIGHFGFFRDRFRTSLWEDAASFLARGHAGKETHLPPW